MPDFEVSSFSHSRDIRGSHNSKSALHDPFTTAFDLILHLIDTTFGDQSACQIYLRFLASTVPDGAPKIPKVVI